MADSNKLIIDLRHAKERDFQALAELLLVLSQTLSAHGCRLTFQLLQKTQPPAEGTGRYKFCNVTGLQTP